MSNDSCTTLIRKHQVVEVRPDIPNIHQIGIRTHVSKLGAENQCVTAERTSTDNM